MKKTSADNKQKKTLLLNRVSRVEGQLRGIRKMIEKDRKCIDIITQITAIKAAISVLGMEILKNDFVCKQKDHKKIDEAYLKTLFKIN